MSDGPGRKPTVSDDEILDVFRNSSGSCADRFRGRGQTLSWRGAYKRLRELAEQEVLGSKQVGNGSKVWWYPGARSFSIN